VEEVKAYIESGILELYVLGQLSAIENKEVEEMAYKYPEVKAEILTIELAMENYAIQNAVEPSANTAAQIFAKISPAEVNDLPTEAKVVSLYTNENDGSIRKLRYALIACSILKNLKRRTSRLPPSPPIRKNLRKQLPNWNLKKLAWKIK
jgi:hypothetical protein